MTESPTAPTLDLPPDSDQILPPALPAGLAHLASLWAPVIRDAGSATGDANRPLQRAPLVQVPLGTPLPQFPVPLHLEIDLARRSPCPPSFEVSDTDETRRLVDSSDNDPTRQIVDSSDSDPTLQRSSIEAHRARALLADVSDAEATRRRPMSSAPPPMTIDTTLELTDFDLQQDLPVDSSLEILLRSRVRRGGPRSVGLIGGLLAVGAIVLGFAGARLARAGAPSDAQSVTDLSAASFGIPRLVAEPRAMEPVAPAPTETTDPTNDDVAVVPIELEAAPRAAAPTPTPPPVAQVTVTKPQPAAPPVVKITTKTAATTGFLDTGAEAKGHRVFVDGFVAGFAPSSIQLKCGVHSVRVGSAGPMQTIKVPCGGRVFVLSQPAAKTTAKPTSKTPSKSPLDVKTKPTSKSTSKSTTKSTTKPTGKSPTRSAVPQK